MEKVQYKDLLRIAQKGMNIVRPQENYYFYLAILKQEWHNVVGGLLSLHSAPIRIAKKSLVIACEHDFLHARNRKP